MKLLLCCWTNNIIEFLHSIGLIGEELLKDFATSTNFSHFPASLQKVRLPYWPEGGSQSPLSCSNCTKNDRSYCLLPKGPHIDMHDKQQFKKGISNVPCVKINFKQHRIKEGRGQSRPTERLPASKNAFLVLRSPELQYLCAQSPWPIVVQVRASLSQSSSATSERSVCLNRCCWILSVQVFQLRTACFCMS